MPDEEIRVRVVEERSGSAVRDVQRDVEGLRRTQAQAQGEGAGGQAAPYDRAQREAEIQRLRAAALQYESKGWMREAQTARTDANAIERDIKREDAPTRNAKAEELRSQRAARQAARQAEADDRKNKGAETRVQRDLAEGARIQGRRADFATEQAALEARGGGDTKKADALDRELRVRQMSARLQRELQVSEEEGTRLAERRVTAEDAIGKSRSGRAGRIAQAGASFAEGAAGGSPFGGVLGAMGSINPVAMAATTAAAITTAMMSTEATRERQMRLLDLGDSAARAQDSRAAMRMGGFEGSASGAREAAREARERAQQIEDQKEKLAEAAKPVWNNSLRDFGLWANNQLGGSMQTPEGEAKIKEAALEQSREVKRAHEMDEALKKQWPKEGALELSAAEKRVAWDPRGARDDERMRAWWSEYNRLQGIGADDEHTGNATRGADLAIAEMDRRDANAFGRLVNARSGAADVARAAALAGREIQGHWRDSGQEIAHKVESLTKVVEHGYTQRRHKLRRS